jgi:uncharacterized protein YdeI (YjbR/CyaY-like superfamily)
MVKLRERPVKAASTTSASPVTLPITTPGKITKKPPAPKQGSRSSSADGKSLETLTFRTPATFDTWLSANHATSPGIWVQIAKKASGIPSITYDEAVDVALCHGWIDGQRKRHATLGESYFVLRFTQRRKRSLWAKRNVEKCEALMAQGRMSQAGLREIEAAKGDGRWDAAYAPPSTIEVPEDFAAPLKEAGVEVTGFWEGLNKTQRYAVLWRIETAKKGPTRERRVREMIEMLRQGKTFH